MVNWLKGSKNVNRSIYWLHTKEIFNNILNLQFYRCKSAPYQEQVG